MFKDPKTANSRIYVGNLNDVVSKGDLETLFQKYGTIQGILNQRKFAFVQFDNENDATNAVENENGTMLNSRKLLVRFAEMGKGSQNNIQQKQDQQSPAGRNIKNNKKHNQHNNNRDRSRSPLNENRSFNSGNEGMGFFGAPTPLMGNNNNINSQNFQPSDYNDCEIIVVSKALTSYAELVEMQLKRLGLTVDLLFPNDDVPIGKVLANIASRGSLYGLLVTPLNEQHRSITVTQLYGDNPTEHRNMPVDEAIKYIYKDFKQKTNDNAPSPNFPTAIQFNTIVQTPELKEAHPDAIQILLNMLCENRPLTVLQYERLIKYLTERKEMQVKAEIGDDISVSEITNLTSAPKGEPVKAVDTEKIKQEELQKKILEILNKPSLTESIKKVEEPKPKIPPIKIGQSSNASSVAANSKIPTDKQNPTSKLLKDEKVQKALDFLLLGKKF